MTCDMHQQLRGWTDVADILPDRSSPSSFHAQFTSFSTVRNQIGNMQYANPSTGHPGFVEPSSFDVLDFKPWYYLEGDAPFCEDDCMEECEDIWGSYDSQNVG